MLLDHIQTSPPGELGLSAATPRLMPPSRQLIFRPRTSPGDLDCWIIFPAYRSNRQAHFTVHGISRNAKLQARLLAPGANRIGQTVIAPVFPKSEWPRYQQVVQKGRADFAFLSLLRDLRNEGAISDQPIELSGFSGGAQFAHRFAMLHPKSVSRLTASSAGWYTFPDSRPFPYGMGNAADGNLEARLARNLASFLALPITICCGERDDKRDPNTRSGAEIDSQQGITRRDRAKRYTDALHRTAASMGIAPRITHHVLPGAAHDFASCVIRAGLDRLIIPGPYN